MKDGNGGSASGIVILLALVLVGGIALAWYLLPRSAPPNSPTSVVVGGDRDAHGCIGSAGYSWCDAKQKCLRPWEEQCGPAALDPAFNALAAIRAADTGVFGYATSSSFEWRLEGNATTTLNGFSIMATDAHNADYERADGYFTSNGFTASMPNEAGGPTGGLQGYQKGILACTLGFSYTDLMYPTDQPVRVNSDAQTITVSCGTLPDTSTTIVPSNWKTYENAHYGFSVAYPPGWTVNDTSQTLQGEMTAAVNITSPVRFDLAGYQGVPVEYRVLMYTPVGGASAENLFSFAGFGSSEPQFGHQSAWNIEVSKTVEEGTAEYKAGRSIISSFTLAPR